MDRVVYLNEMSFASAPDSPSEGSSRFEELFRVLRLLDRRVGGVVVVGHEPLTSLSIGGTYSIALWVAGDRDRMRRVQSLRSRAPFDGAFEALSIEMRGELEFTYDGNVVVGLGLASWHDTLAVSVHWGPWQHSVVVLERLLLCEEPSGEVRTTEAVIRCRHVATEQHVDEHSDWLRVLVVDAPRTPDELWIYRGRWYPRIAFLPRVQAQVRDLMAGEPSFGQVVEKLATLQSALASWNGSGWPAWGVQVAGEYEGREKFCWFEDLDGESRLFEHHVRFAPGAGRIHFRLDGPRRRIVVAHIGRKLGI